MSGADPPFPWGGFQARAIEAAVRPFSDNAELKLAAAAFQDRIDGPAVIKW